MDDPKKRPTKSERTVKRLAALLSGKASRTVTVKAKLTGTAADAWIMLREAGEGLTLTDDQLVAALVEYGARAACKALRDMPRG